MLDLHNLKDDNFVKAEKIFEELKNVTDPIINERVNFRGKCGEVFLENGQYLITCYFCNTHATTIDTLIKHIYQEHLILKVPVYVEPLNTPSVSNNNNNRTSQKPKNVIVKVENDIRNINKEIKQESLLINVCTEDDLNMATNTKLYEISDENNHILQIPESPVEILNNFGQYSCSFCTNTFNEFSELENHFLEHTTTTEIETSLQDSENMDLNFINDIPQFDKILPARIEGDEYCCKLCDRKYKFEKSYRAHFKKNHTKNLSEQYFKPFKCPECTSSFRTSERYEIHLRWHKREKPHKCEYCERSFSLKANLTTHINIHLGIKPYACTFCPKTFTQQNSQKAHERNIHTKERPHQCELCGKSFPRSTLLKEHWKRHTNTRKFQCELCFKSFFNNHSLQSHINRHTGNKTYDCNLCPRKFRDGNTLKAHKKLHLDKKEYKCKLCNREFAQKPGLYGHMKLFHKSVTTIENNADEPNIKEFES